MLYYLLFWALLGFIFHFYIIFGTNLLTGGPAQNCCFCLFQCFEEKEYQTESKRNETFGRVIFGTEAIQETWTLRQESHEAVTRVEGAPLGRAPLPRGPLEAPPTYFLHPYILTYPKTSRTENRSGVPPPEASIATENQSRSVPAPCNEWCQRERGSRRSCARTQTSTGARKQGTNIVRGHRCL